MRISILIVVVVLGAFALTCTNQQKTNVDIAITISSGSDEGYSIRITDSLIKTNEVRIVQNNDKLIENKVINTREGYLSHQQLVKLKEYQHNLKSFDIYVLDKKLQVNDDWFFKVNIDKSKVIEFSTFTLCGNDSYFELKQLIDYIIEISPLKIKLRAFS